MISELTYNRVPSLMSRSRHGLAITLTAIGVLLAVLLTVILRLATNDQFQAWAKAQPWYTLQRIWLAAGLLVVFVITIAIWQYAIAHPRKTTEMTMEIGIVDPDSYSNPPFGTSSPKESSVLFLLDVPETAVTIVYCLLRLTNSGDHGINGVRIQIEYPEEYLVDEGVVVLFEKIAAIVREPGAPTRSERIKREVSTLAGTVRVSYNLNLLRYGETVVVPEPLKIRRDGEPGRRRRHDFNPSALTARLALKSRFIDYLRLRTFVFSQESKLERAFDVFSFSGSKPADLDAAIAAIKDAVWNGKFPAPGYYWTPFGWRDKAKASRLEFCVPQLRAELPGQLYQEVPLESNCLGISPLLLPPVDFRHTDTQASLGFRVTRRTGSLQPDVTFLTRKAPPPYQPVPGSLKYTAL